MLVSHLRTANHSKSKISTRFSRVMHGSSRRSNARGQLSPAAAPDDSCEIQPSCTWIRGRSRRILLVYIPAPFPDVARHIIQSKRIGILLTNRVCLTSTVVVIPGNFTYRVCPCIFEILSCTSRILPLCLSGESIPFGVPVARHIQTVDGIDWFKSFQF